MLEGALECLQTKGYAHATARDIAAAAHANVGSINYHFGSKDQLLNEALVEGFRRWTAHLTARVGVVEAGDTAERLRTSWETMRVELAEQGPLLQAFFEALAPASRSPELREQLAGFYREVRADVAAQASESLPRTPEAGDAARVIASLLMALFDGLQFQWFLEPAQTPSAAEIEQALGLVVAALAAGAAQPS